METLPRDIIVDVLSRLPVKAIGRSRCVSKPWNSLLSHSHFIQTHLKYGKQTLPKQEELVILVSNDSHSLYSAHLINAHHMFDEITAAVTKLTFVDHLFSSANIRGVASCDGLLLVRDEEKMFSLINPVTKEINKLPSIPVVHDPNCGLPFYGIGYDSINDDYKVVAISYCKTGNENEPSERVVNVYSVRNGTWKRVQSSPYFHADIYGGSVYFNGCIHWVATRTCDLSSVIAAFDLKEEKFHELPWPSSVANETHRFNHLRMFGGCLGIQFYLTKGVVDFWKMEAYGVAESWTKFSIVDPDNALLRPVCALRDKHVVLVKYGTCRVMRQKLVVYNLEERTFKDIVLHDIPDNFRVERTFMESLVSPHCKVETATEC